jgi:hypothetical protein
MLGQEVLVKYKEVQQEVSVNLDIDDFFKMINGLEDGCGCPDCKTLVHKIKKSFSENR